MTEMWVWPVGLGVLGLILGSFIATIAIRWPEGRSAAAGQSECDSCHKILGPIELVPVLSYVAQGGKCRACGGRIAISHPVTELLGGAIGVAAGWLAPGVEGAFGAGLGWILLALAAVDYAAFWLPNILTFTLALGGIADWYFTELEPNFAARLAGGIAGFAALYLVALAYRAVRGRHGLGGGDPKMFGALGLWFGIQALPMLLLIACLWGFAIIAGAMLIRRGVSGTTKLPFGVMLALAGASWWVMITPRDTVFQFAPGETIRLIAVPSSE